MSEIIIDGVDVSGCDFLITKWMLLYILISGVAAGTMLAVEKGSYYNQDITLAYFILGSIFGWIIIPVKAINGFKTVILDLIAR